MTIFLNLDEVLVFRHRSRSSHFRDIENGLCTSPVKVGPRSVAWLRSELELLRAAVIAGKSETRIKQIVFELEVLRQSAYSKLAGDDQ